MVDLVLPYVNNKDSVWVKAFTDFCQTHSQYADKLEMINGERYRDEFNLFPLNLKLIRVCLPFIRTIHLIVSNKEQVEGLDLTGVHLVLHEDIMPKEILPTFCSSTIEMFIGNIEGLAEKFIYINDDMIPTRVMSESDFFDGDCAKMQVYTLHETTNNSLFREMVVRQYREVFKGTEDYLGDDFYLRPEHSASPMFKSLVNEARAIYAPSIEKHLEPFREVEQHNQYLYHFHAYRMGRVKPTNLKFIYLRLEKPDFLNNCYAICDKSGSHFDWICVNDNEEERMLQDRELRYKVLKKALELCLEYIKKGANNE